MSAGMLAVRDRTQEFAFDDRHFTWFVELVYGISGVVLNAGKRQLVYSRLAKRVRATGVDGFAAYIALVKNDTRERDMAVYALTTNHTKFFREDHHFDHLAKEAWPPLAATLATGRPVRIWSAACSSGEEPYSIAMTLLGPRREAGLALQRRDVQILATDLTPSVLETGKAGRYPADVLEPVPADLRSAWVRRSGDQGEIDPAVRAMVAFRQLNLLGDWPMRRPFDIIFCRNVMIYFDDATKERLQARLAAQLAPGGHLYIGHSERLLGAVDRQFRAIGHTIYRKVAP